MNNISSVFRRQ